MLTFWYLCRGNFPERLGRPYESGASCSGCRESCSSTEHRHQKSKRRKILRKSNSASFLPLKGRQRRLFPLLNRHRRKRMKKLVERSKNKSKNRSRRKRRKKHQSRKSFRGQSQAHPLAFPKHSSSSSSTSLAKSPPLCTNSCPVADLWMNCGELASQWKNWLCEENQERYKNCRATCTCQGKIKNWVNF